MMEVSVLVDVGTFVRAAKEEKIGYDLFDQYGTELGECRFFKGSHEGDVEAHYQGDAFYKLIPVTLLGQMFLSLLVLQTPVTTTSKAVVL